MLHKVPTSWRRSPVSVTWQSQAPVELKYIKDQGKWLFRYLAQIRSFPPNCMQMFSSTLLVIPQHSHGPSWKKTGHIYAQSLLRLCRNGGVLMLWLGATIHFFTLFLKNSLEMTHMIQLLDWLTLAGCVLVLHWLTRVPAKDPKATFLGLIGQVKP